MYINVLHTQKNDCLVCWHVPSVCCWWQLANCFINIKWQQPTTSCSEGWLVWWVLAAWHKSKCVTMIRHNPWHHLHRPSHLKSQFSKDETLLLLSQPHPHLHTLTVRKCHKSNPQSFWVELVDTRYSTFKYVVHCAFNIWFSHMLLCLDLFIKWMSSLNLKLVWINSPEQTTILGRVKIRNKNTQAHIISIYYTDVMGGASAECSVNNT